MITLKNFAPKTLLTLSLLLLIPSSSSATNRAQKRKGLPSHRHTAAITRAEMKQADARMAELGYVAVRNALIAFRKYEGRKVAVQVSRDDIDETINATAPH